MAWFAVQEPNLIHIHRVAVDALDGPQDVVEVIGDAQRLAHTGTASERILLRNFSGNALGVSTSTDTPRKRSSST